MVQLCEGAFDGTSIDLYPNKKQQLQKEFNSIPNTTPLKNEEILSRKEVKGRQLV